MLALIYAGEMCYWYVKHNGDMNRFNARVPGLTILNKYLHVIAGPLNNAGWSSTSAQRMKDYLENCDPS